VAWFSHVNDKTSSFFTNTHHCFSLYLLFDWHDAVTCVIYIQRRWQCWNHSVRQPYYHHQLNFVIFAYAQILTIWCHNGITISSCKLVLKTREYILSFIVTAHNMSYIAYNTFHVTHCMLHHNTYIDVLVSNILFFFLFRECSDRVGTSDPFSCSLCWKHGRLWNNTSMLVCCCTFIVIHSMSRIVWHKTWIWYLAKCSKSFDLFVPTMIHYSVIESGKDVFVFSRQNKSYLVTWILHNLLFVIDIDYNFRLQDLLLS